MLLCTVTITTEECCYAQSQSQPQSIGRSISPSFISVSTWASKKPVGTWQPHLHPQPILVSTVSSVLSFAIIATFFSAALAAMSSNTPPIFLLEACMMLITSKQIKVTSWSFILVVLLTSW